MSPLPPMTTIFMIVPFILDLGISSPPAVHAKTQHPNVLGHCPIDSTRCA